MTGGIHILCVGTELLTGDTVNTNLADAGRMLAKAGWRAASSAVVPDVPDVMSEALIRACRQSSAVIVSGGLGPTGDDLTRQLAADILGVPLVHSAPCEESIRAFLDGRGLQVPESAILAQSLVPSGASLLPNVCGTAPGLVAEHGECLLVLLPGPPREFRPMFRDQVIPLLSSRLPAAWAARVLCVCGRAESAVAERVDRLLGHFPDLAIAYCARPSGVHVRLTVAAEAGATLDAACAQLRRDLDVLVLPDGMLRVEQHVAALLQQQGRTLGTAESCTGGLIAAQITDLPGSSAYFGGSIVSYANAWKQEHLGVLNSTLNSYGAVSPETASEMLDGLLERTGVDAGLSVTGIAGPGGGTTDKPVGLVYIGVAVDRDRSVHRFIFRGTRETVRARTAGTALDLLRLALLRHGGAEPADIAAGTPYVKATLH